LQFLSTKKNIFHILMYLKKHDNISKYYIGAIKEKPCD
jgi:hypothetical protein